jgi:hypothetical protein
MCSLYLMTTLAASAAGGNDLVKIEVQGTFSDTLPDRVEVFVSNPRDAAGELVKNGGKRLR